GAGQNQNGQGTPAVEVINFPGTIAAVTVNDKGEIVVKGADGNETVYKRAKDAKTGKPKEAVVADAAGNSYSVDKDGKVTKGANTGNTNASADARGIKFPLFVIYGHDLDKTIYYCASAALDAKTKNELEASIKEKLKTSTWSDMPESQVVFNNDCSIAYTDNLSVRRGAVVYSEQNKKVFFADLSKDYDFAWKLNGSDYTPGASLQEADLKKGNNSLELEVLTKSSAGLHAKVTLQINYGKFDINNYRVKVVRNGRPYYYKDQQFVGKENGEIPLKEDEAIQLTLEQKDEQTSWKLLENVEWMLSHSEDSKVVNTTLPLVFTETFTHDYVVAKIPSTTEAFRVDFRKETYELAPPNPITKPDVTRLATNLQAKREDLFNWAMNTIQTKNTTLYSSITGERASTKVYIVPVNDADFTGLTSGINGNVKGVTNFLYRERVDYFPLLSTVNPQLSGSVIVSATLITKLSDKEKEEIIKAISAKMKTDQYEFFYGKVKAYSGESGAMLDKAMADGAIAPDELDKLVYKVGAEDVNKFIDLVSSTKDVYLNDANIKTASDNSSEPFERTFIKTLAHELTHIHFKATSKLDYLTWEIIRKNKNGQYDLKDQLGNNCGCSAGPGHECHNPENSAVCGEENNYNTVKRSK
ncbi:MAG: hypothetical protein K2U26_00830, partial [Cyclobacteriaceae bacterium]|nr:hypothetical protein [Cyclobacteriaceae bacterium]